MGMLDETLIIMSMLVLGLACLALSIHAASLDERVKKLEKKVHKHE